MEPTADRRWPAPSRPGASGIVLWRPDIVAARSITRPGAGGRIVPAEPGLRPTAVAAQVAAGRSALARLAEAQAALDAQAAALQLQVTGAGTERERVAAVMETYRIKTALDDAFQTTLRHVGALMEERGRR
jgi:hypothetical protein